MKVEAALDTTHYPIYADMLKKLEGPNLYIPTEFLHGLYDGGHGSGLQDFWDTMRSSPFGVGRFLWVFADEGLRRADDRGRIDNDGNHAPDGLVGPYNENEPSYYAVRDIYCPFVLTEPNMSAKWNGRVRVLNDYYFTLLNQCTLRWELGDFPNLQDTSAIGFKVSDQDELTPPRIAPQATGEIKLPLPKKWYQHDALRLSAYDREGNELRQWTWPIRSQEEFAKANLPDESGDAATVTEEQDSLVLAAGSTRITISKDTGYITAINTDGQTISLNNGPRIVGGTGTLKSVTHKADGKQLFVTATFAGNLQFVTYTMRADGWLRIDYALDITDEQANIGLTFDYPQDLISSMRWLGNGPEPVWKNRLAGTMLGVWNKHANNPARLERCHRPSSCSGGSPDVSADHRARNHHQHRCSSRLHCRWPKG